MADKIEAKVNQAEDRLEIEAGKTRHLSWSKKILLFCLAAFAFLLLVVLGPSSWVKISTLNKIEPSQNYLRPGSYFDAIVVFGAGLNPDGSPCLMLADRLNEAALLYLGGVAEKVILTGDQTPPFYDEVAAMKAYIEKLGVPLQAIETDPRGHSTFASVYNLLNRSQQDSYLFVTQKYHLPRAVYIGQQLGLKVYGAPTARNIYPGSVYYYLREFLARDKDLVKVWLYQ